MIVLNDEQQAQLERVLDYASRGAVKIFDGRVPCIVRCALCFASTKCEDAENLVHKDTCIAAIARSLKAWVKEQSG